MKTEMAIQQILTEFNRNAEKRAPFASPHEGYAFLHDELEDLFIMVRNSSQKTALRAEAKEVAAMALRFMVDLT